MPKVLHICQSNKHSLKKRKIKIKSLGKNISKNEFLQVLIKRNKKIESKLQVKIFANKNQYNQVLF